MEEQIKQKIGRSCFAQILQQDLGGQHLHDPSYHLLFSHIMLVAIFKWIEEPSSNLSRISYGKTRYVKEKLGFGENEILLHPQQKEKEG